jgi:hypothetical protein
MVAAKNSAMIARTHGKTRVCRQPAAIVTPEIRSPPPMIEQCGERPSTAGDPTAQMRVEMWVGTELYEIAQ